MTSFLPEPQNTRGRSSTRREHGHVAVDERTDAARLEAELLAHALGRKRHDPIPSYPECAGESPELQPVGAAQSGEDDASVGREGERLHVFLRGKGERDEDFGDRCDLHVLVESERDAGVAQDRLGRTAHQ